MRSWGLVCAALGMPLHLAATAGTCLSAGGHEWRRDRVGLHASLFPWPGSQAIFWVIGYCFKDNLMYQSPYAKESSPTCHP